MRRFRREGLVLVALCPIGLPTSGRAQSTVPAACRAVDSVALGQCIGADSAAGQALLLREALSRGADSNTVAHVAVASARTRYRQAESTKRPEQFRAVVELAPLADSLRPSDTARFLGAIASVRLWERLKHPTSCETARESVQHLEIAPRYPFRPDPGLEPDSMRLQHQIERWLSQARSQVRALCAPSTRRAP